MLTTSESVDADLKASDGGERAHPGDVVGRRRGRAGGGGGGGLRGDRRAPARARLRCRSRSACSPSCRRRPRWRGAGRARSAARRSGPCHRPASRARRSAAAGSPASTSSRRAATSRLVAEGDRVYGRVVETPDAARRSASRTSGRRASGGSPRARPRTRGRRSTRRRTLLAREGFSFRDVARTWFYLRDILDWYGPFNAVRNAAFRRMGLVGPGGDGQIPASTGIEGRNTRGGWCALDLLALQPRTGGRLEMKRLHNRKQNEATEYGSAFARAMEVVLGDARYVFVSGTASIDDHGATVHVGDFEAQTRYTLEAVAGAPRGRGRRLADVAPGDGVPQEPLRRRARSSASSSDRGLEQAPLVTTVADVCRDDLLFEIDATAVVPLAAGPGGDGARPAGARPRPRPGRALRWPWPSRARRRARRPSPRRWSSRRSRSRRRPARSPAARCAAARARAAGSSSSPPDGTARVLTAGFDSAADPEVSFDGKSDPVRGEEGGRRSLVRLGDEGGRDRARARSPAARPARASPSTSRRSTRSRRRTSSRGCRSPSSATNPGERNEAGVAPNTSLWSCKTDGTALRRLTFNLSNDIDPVILPDGRMVYAGWLRARRARAADRVALLGVNEDGTDYQIYAGDQGLRVKQMPAPTADGLVVFVEADRDRRATARAGSPSVSQVRPLHTYRSLTSEADGLFRAPSPLPDGRVLVAWRPRRRARSRFGIYRFDPATGAREKAFEDPAWHSRRRRSSSRRARCPTPARASCATTTPRASSSRSTSTSTTSARALPSGTAKTPARRRGRAGVGATGPPRRRLLGEIPLAEDGSFQVQVPANTPLQLQLLDARRPRRSAARRGSGCATTRRRAASAATRIPSARRRTASLKALAAPAPVLNLPPEKRRTRQLRGGREADRRSRSAWPATAAAAGAPRLDARRGRARSRRARARARRGAAALVVAPARPQHRAAVGRRGRRAGAEPLPAGDAALAPTRSGPSSSGSISEDSHEAPRLRSPARSCARGERRRSRRPRPRPRPRASCPSSPT